MSFFHGVNPFLRTLPEDRTYKLEDTAIATTLVGLLGGARYYKLSARDPILTSIAKKILFSRPVIYTTVLAGGIFLGTKIVSPIPSQKKSG